MHYVALVNIDGEVEEREVEVTELSAGHYQIVMGERRFDVNALPVSETSLSFMVDNDAYNIEFEQDQEGGQNLLIRDHVMHIEVLDLRKMRLRAAQTAAAGTGGPAPIVSPMPGKVVAVLVKEGDAVKKGQGLVVVEAMKMENELRAPQDGVIRDLKAEEGVAVDGGAALCIVDAPPSTAA